MLGAGHPALAALEESGIEASEHLVLRRIQSSDGRSRAFINDAPCSVQLLRRVGEALVEIHGQHDDRAMTDPATHRKLLDAFAGLSDEAVGLTEAYDDWKGAETALSAHEAHIAKVRENADYLTHALEELRSIDPKEDEEETLSQRRQLMMHAEKISDDLAEARSALHADGTMQSRLSAALRKLERQPDETAALLQPVTRALERVMIETNEAREQLDRAIAGTEFSSAELELAEERLFSLRALARKHQVPVSALAGLIVKFDGELQALDADEQTLSTLRKDAEAAAQAYQDAAKALSDKRRAAAMRLDEEVVAELAPLKLEKARFTTHIETCALEEGGPAGLDRVDFWVQTNPGTAPGAMMKVASGGELARFLLALKVVLAARGSAPTLIFDEIDTGVGGATASAIGERLARLSSDLQVVAVTHAPQVAAQARGHLRISKETLEGAGEETVATRVSHLDEPDRREEIARMLAGQTVTDEARAAAERLIGRQA